MEENKIKLKILSRVFDFLTEEDLADIEKCYSKWSYMELDIFNVLCIKGIIEKDMDVSDVFPSEILLFHYPVERFEVVWNEMKKRYGYTFWEKFYDEEDEFFGETLTDIFMRVDASLPEYKMTGTIELIRHIELINFDSGKGASK